MGGLAINSTLSITCQGWTESRGTGGKLGGRHFGYGVGGSSGSYWKDSSLTFPFLSNFDGLTCAVLDLIQTLSDLVEL